jgi:hypothetical protein
MQRIMIEAIGVAKKTGLIVKAGSIGRRRFFHSAKPLS